MARSCSRCATALSVYNGGTLCGPCEVAMRGEPGENLLPLTFWFRPDVRRALARWDWGAVLTATSSETHLSQTHIAALVGLSQAQVSRLMGGRSKEPGIRTVIGIVDALGVPRLLAGLAPRGLDHLAVHSGDDDTATVDHVNRRTLGKAVIGITLAIPLAGTEPGEPVDVTRLRANDVVADLYALDDRYGGAAIADIARRRLAGLTRQMDRATLSPDAETRVQSMIGELSTCCAWLAFDGGDHQRARTFDADALCAAHMANDKDLQVEVLANMSMQAKRAGKPGEALNLAESAMAIARGADPRIKALLSMRMALAHAKRQDAAGFTRSRRAAWKQLEHAHPISRPAWFRFFDDRELAALEALGLLELGRAAEAANILAEVIEEQHTFLRNAAYYSAARAQALLAAGEPGAAAEVIQYALPVFTEVTSARTFDRLKDVRDGLRPYLPDPEIAECDDFLAGLVS